MRSLVARALPLFAVAVLVLNDHVLKARFPGLVTGKLSDLAGLFFFPLLLTDVTCAVLRVHARQRAVLLGACAATAIVFALVKTTPAGHEVYCVGLGLLQWPFRALAALLRGAGLPALRPVRMTMDATDLVALVSIPGGYVHGTRGVTMR